MNDRFRPMCSLCFLSGVKIRESMVSVWSTIALAAFQVPQDPPLDQNVLEPLTAVTFAAQPGEVYVPLRPLAEPLGWQVEWSNEDEQIAISGRVITERSIHRNEQRISFIKLSSLPYLSVLVEEAGEGMWNLSLEDKQAQVKAGEQRVEINLSEQRLMAFQGPYLVMTTNVSTGRRGYGTPPGKYKAQSKARHRVSRTYDNAPMPYSVQLKGGYFIHGSGSVPRRPASHGCVRMPLTGANPARMFFNWVEIGTPIEIRRDWSEEAAKVADLEV